MNTRKIWIIAMIFGLVAAGMMYLVVTDAAKNDIPVASSKNNVKEKENPEQKEPTEKETEPQVKAEEITSNRMLPVQKGNRAMTIQVTDTTGVAGNIEPGDHVDVVAVMTVPKEYKDKQHDSATLLLQNVKVLGVGHAADDQAAKTRYQMVTLEVTPKQGLALGFSSRYELYLMLRKESDGKLAPKDTHIHEDDLHEGVFK